MYLAAALLILATTLDAQTASVWSERELDALTTNRDIALRSGAGYSILLRTIRGAERHRPGDPSDHMLWIRKGSVRVIANGRTEAGPGDLIRVPRRTPWSIQPKGGEVQLADIRIEPLGVGRSSPEGIRPVPGRMGLHISKAEIDAVIARTEANAPLHTQDNFTANFVLFKGRVGPWESHAGCTDIYLVQTGEGVIQTGGTIENAKDAGPGEPRGTAIVGSRENAVAAGDLLVIPRNVAHHMNPRTLPLAYVLIKVWSE